jgi:hypothetical protein
LRLDHYFEESSVAKRLRSRLTRTSAFVVIAAALAAPTANAGLLPGLLGSNCNGIGAPVFAPWGDFHPYYLAPNGGLEGGSNGWTLSGGASVVGGNQPYFPSGGHSLSLPSGSSALSPTLCLGPDQVAVRMFGSDTAGSDSGLRARVVWYGLLNKVLGISDYATFTPGKGWAPTAAVSSSGGYNVLLPLLGSTSARLQLTPLGNGSNWRIDDLYVDPIASRCC